MQDYKESKKSKKNSPETTDYELHTLNILRNENKHQELQN